MKSYHGNVEKIHSTQYGKLLLRRIPHVEGLGNLSIYHVTMLTNYRHNSLYHANTHEWFYVLNGKVTITVDGKPKKLKRGEFFYMAPGTLHQVASGREKVQVLVIFSPPINEKHPDIVTFEKNGAKLEKMYT